MRPRIMRKEQTIFVHAGSAAAVSMCTSPATPPVVVRQETVRAIVSMGARFAREMRRLLTAKTAAKKKERTSTRPTEWMGIGIPPCRTANTMRGCRVRRSSVHESASSTSRREMRKPPAAEPMQPPMMARSVKSSTAPPWSGIAPASSSPFVERKEIA